MNLISQEEISAFQNDSAEMDQRLQNTIFADLIIADEWLQERGL